MPLPGASELDTNSFDTNSWSRGGGGHSAASDGRRHGAASVSAAAGADDSIEDGGDPFAVLSGSLKGLNSRGEGEFETIDWTFYQERDRQCDACLPCIIHNDFAF